MNVYKSIYDKRQRDRDRENKRAKKRSTREKNEDEAIIRARSA